MPQPDNKRARGAATQLPGQTVAPEGVGGVIGGDGAAISGAISNLQQNAPTQIQIGQQARIKEDGTKLYNILQGAAVGAQQGIENYGKMYQYVSEKEYAAFETELAEQQRLTGGDARKMAEWAKASAYRPNDVTAKKYNMTMAQIEGKEADVLENEKLNGDLSLMSKLTDGDALDQVNRNLASADPDSRYYAVMSQERNRLNGAVAGTGRKIQNLMYKSEVQTTSFELGAALNAAGIGAHDLAAPRASDVARMYALMGGGQNSDRIVIGAQGEIQYLDNQGVTHQGNFQGAIGDEMAAAIARDLGEFAGDINNPDSIDTTRFDELATVMQYGGFSKNHTSTRAAAAPKIGDIDPAGMVISASRGASPDEMAAIIRADVPTAVSPEDADRAKKGFVAIYQKSFDAITASDMSLNEKNAALDSMLLSLAGDTPVWKDYGFHSRQDYDSEVGELRKTLTKERTRGSMGIIGEAAARVAEENQLEQSIDNLRGRSNNLVLETAATMAGIDGTMDMSIVDTNGKEITSFHDFMGVQLALAKNPALLDNGWAIRLNPSGLQAGTRGRAQALAEENPLIFIGSEGQPLPQNLTEAVAVHSKNVRELKNIDRVVQVLSGPSKDVVLPGDITDAGLSLLSRVNPENPDSAKMLSWVLANPNTPDVSRATIANEMMTRDRDGVLAAMRPTDLSFGMIRNPGQVGPEDAAKIGNLRVLAGRSSTADLALAVIEGDSGATNETSRIGWELMQGPKFTNIFDARYGEVNPDDPASVAARNALMDKAYGSSKSPAIAAMSQEWEAAMYGVINPSSQEDLPNNIATFQKDPVMQALSRQFAQANEGKDLLTDLSIPETRNSAVAWVQYNLQLAKSLEVWAPNLSGGTATSAAATMSANTGKASKRADFLAQQAMVEIIDNMTASNGTRAAIPAETAASTTVQVDGAMGSVQETVARTLWEQARGRNDFAGVSDPATTASMGLLEVLEVDPAEYNISPSDAALVVENWASGESVRDRFGLALIAAVDKQVTAEWDIYANDSQRIGSTESFYSGTINTPEDATITAAGQGYVTNRSVTVPRRAATADQRVEALEAKDAKDAAIAETGMFANFVRGLKLVTAQGKAAAEDLRTAYANPRIRQDYREWLKSSGNSSQTREDYQAWLKSPGNSSKTREDYQAWRKANPATAGGPLARPK